MAELDKAGGGLNLASLKSAPQPGPDANAGTQTNNAPATAAGEPKAPSQPAPTQNTTVIESDLSLTPETQAIVDEHSAQNAADAGITGAAEGEKIYSSYPVLSLKVGRFQFENGSLRLSDAKDQADFNQILNALPPRDRRMVNTVNLDKVDAIVQARQAATRQFDSSVGREAMDALRGPGVTVGVQDIAHAANPQMSHNIPVIPTEPVDPEGKTGLDQGPHLAPDQVPGQP